MATPLSQHRPSDTQEQVKGSPREQARIGASKTTPSKRRVGFECDFVERPPEIFQSECPVCLLIVREPNQVTCCGYSFCRACIERIVASKKSCPTCNKREFSVFPDKRLQRSLYQFRVRCEHGKAGCKWSGELGQLDKHLNENPGADSQLEGCEFTRVACIHCVQLFERRLVTAHQIESCPQRPYSCDYCGNYSTNLDDVVTNHWPVCGYRPVPCPNECGVYPERRNFHEHVNKDCPLALVSCDFHHAGCQVRLPRRDIPSHLNESLSSHMALLGAHSQRMAEKVVEKDEKIERLTNELSNKLEENKQKIDELEQEIAQLREEVTTRESQERVAAPRGVFSPFRNGATPRSDNEVLKREVAELSSKQEKLLSYLPAFPIDITMTNFVKHKRDGDDWYSEPFYTHPHGYKMCLCVYANGDGSGKGTHVSVFACLMRGEFDDHLRWPLQAHVTIRLLNQLEDREHREQTIRCSDTSNPESVGRVTGKERATGCGTPTFLRNERLGNDPVKNCHYLKDDCLRFQVTRVINVDYTVQLERRCLAIESRVIITPIDFTMPDFNQQKQNGEEWYSMPFYTHARGYRMCLNVIANDHSDSKGTHVSVFVCLMRGEFDDHLKWPFRGDITMQLLNELEDKEHHTKTIHFTDETPYTSAGRVTTGERGEEWGFDKFIAHGELNYNFAKNRQYLKNNCLRFGVKKVELKN